MKQIPKKGEKPRPPAGGKRLNKSGGQKTAAAPHHTAGNNEKDVITNEIETTSLDRQQDKAEIVSTSIYDPRPRSRSYRKNKNKSYTQIKRERVPKKFLYRQKNYKNYNLPIREKESDFNIDVRYLTIKVRGYMIFGSKYLVF